MRAVRNRYIQIWWYLPRQDFSTWTKDRISKYEFVENTDFIKLPKTGELENKGFIKVVENLAPQKNGAKKSMTYDNLQIGLKTVLRSMSLSKIKILFAFRKKMKRNGQTVKSVYRCLTSTTSPIIRAILENE